MRDIIIASNVIGAGNFGRFRFEDISGLPWTEIDFLGMDLSGDMMKACALVSELVG